MSTGRLAMVAALIALSVPSSSSADSSDLHLKARVVRSTEGLSNLIVTAVNPSRLDMCLVYLPGPSNVEATRNGEALPRGDIAQVRPAMGCYRVPGETDLTFAIALDALYPQGLPKGTRVCTSLLWRYATAAAVLTRDERPQKVCAVTR